MTIGYLSWINTLKTTMGLTSVPSYVHPRTYNIDSILKEGWHSVAACRCQSCEDFLLDVHMAPLLLWCLPEKDTPWAWLPMESTFAAPQTNVHPEQKLSRGFPSWLWYSNAKEQMTFHNDGKPQQSGLWEQLSCLLFVHYP